MIMKTDLIFLSDTSNIHPSSVLFSLNNYSPYYGRSYSDSLYARKILVGW